MFSRLIQLLTSPKISIYLIAMMFSLPFIVAYHEVPIAAFYGEWLATLLGLLSLTALLNKGYWQLSQLPKISLVFLGLLLICNIQLILGLEPLLQHSVLIQLYLLWACLLSALGYYLRQTIGWEKLALILAKAFIFSFFVNAVFVALQILHKLGYSVPIPRLQGYGMVAQANNFADFISLAIVSLLYLYSKKLIKFKILSISLLAGLLMLSLAGSRSSMLYLLAIIALSLVLHLRFQKEGTDTSTSKNLLKISIALLPLFVIIQLLLAAYLPASLLIHTPISRGIDAISTQSASLRWQFWQTSLNLFFQHPWLGIGAGQMRWQTFLLIDHSAANPAHIFFEHAHNLFLNLLAEMGLIAGLIVFLGLATWLKSFFKHQTLDLETWWLLGLVAIIGIHSLLEYPLWYTYFLGVFAFLLGAGEVRTLDLNRLSQAARRLLKLVLALILIYGIQQLYLMQNAYQKLEKHIAIMSPSKISDMQKQRLIEDMLWVRDNTLLAPYADLVLISFINPNKASSDIQIKLAESGLKFIPLQTLILKYVILLEMHQRHGEAIQFLRRAWLMSDHDLANANIENLSPQHQATIHALLKEVNTDTEKQ
jgi:O-antigen ligase